MSTSRPRAVDGREALGEALAGEVASALATPRPLSQSPLWRLHDDYFRRSGVTAWTSGDVPYLLTNSPMVARAYAQVIEGVIEDCVAGRFGPLQLGEPIYLLELGAGVGRLAYNLIHALDVVADAPPVVYVLSDAFESNLDFWRTHPRLAPLLDTGRLDIALYDASRGGDLVLERSGRLLRPGELANPLITIANYVFDVLRQDLFCTDRGHLLEELVAIEPPGPDTEVGSPAFFRHMLVRAEPSPLAGPRYGDVDLDAILAEVALERSEEPSRFLFPVQAITAVRHLIELSGGRLVLLLGERPGEALQPANELPPAEPAEADATSLGATPGAAAVSSESAASDSPPGEKAQAGKAMAPLPPGTYRPGHLLAMGVHGGSISLPVDLDILGRLVTRRGGTLVLPEASPAGLLVAAFVAGDGGQARATRRRFRLAIDEGGPEDLFLSLRAMLDRGTEDLPLSMALALLRVGGYDAHLFRQMHDRLAQVLPGADAAGVDEAARVMREVWDRFYPVDDRTDLAFGIAALLAPAGRVADALEFLGYSHDHRPTPLGAYNTALCHLLLGDEQSAEVALDEALALDPQLEVGLELRRQMHERRAAPASGRGGDDSGASPGR